MTESQKQKKLREYTNLKDSIEGIVTHFTSGSPEDDEIVNTLNVISDLLTSLTNTLWD